MVIYVVTPDFEEWLGRQEFPVEETVDLERWLEYLEAEMGIHGGSLDVAREIYGERYKGLEEYGIRPVERHYYIAGEPFVETRYAISEMRGLFGKFRAYEIGSERAREAGDVEIANILYTRYRWMEEQPERRKVIWRERR